MTIELSRLVAIDLTAMRLTAERDGLSDRLREARAELADLRRRRDTAETAFRQMGSEGRAMTTGSGKTIDSEAYAKGELAKFDAKIGPLTEAIARIEKLHNAARARASAALSLLQRCEAYAAEHGVRLPSWEYTR